MNEVVMYSKPKCPNCTKTVNLFEALGVPYRSIDITKDSSALARVKSLGYLQAPVVELPNGKHWGGFNESEIRDFADTLDEDEKVYPKELVGAGVSSRFAETSDDDWDF